MLHKMRIPALLLLAGLFSVSAPGGETVGMHMDMRVRVDAAAQKIYATVEIDNPAAKEFRLHKGFRMRQALADGKAVAFSVDPDGKVHIGGGNLKKLLLRYDGVMETPASDPDASGSVVSTGLTELDMDSSWYPFFSEKKLENFSFRLQADLPQSFLAVANARQIARHVKNGRQNIVWQTDAPTFDMALVASPQFRVKKSVTPDGGIAIYYVAVPDTKVDMILKDATDVRRELVRLYGKLPLKETAEIVYSPRAGQGSYSRTPLVVTPQSDVLKFLDGKFPLADHMDGEAALYYGNAHEISHFWWIVSDITACDGWINEGVAEFTAIRAVEKRFPGEGAKILAYARQDILKNKTQSAIAETLIFSRDHYRNWYERPALMLFEAQDKFGEEAINRMLRSVYVQFAGTHNATTEAFIAAAEKQIGPEARDYFRAALYTRPALPAAATPSAAPPAVH